MTDELKKLMKSALASYEAAGVSGSEGARAMRESLARIEKLEAALLAADELARECERIAPIVGEAIDVFELGDKHGIATPNKFRAALAAYRRAIAGGGE